MTVRSWVQVLEAVSCRNAGKCCIHKTQNGRTLTKRELRAPVYLTILHHDANYHVLFFILLSENIIDSCLVNRHYSMMSSLLFFSLIITCPCLYACVYDSLWWSFFVSSFFQITFFLLGSQWFCLVFKASCPLWYYFIKIIILHLQISQRRLRILRELQAASGKIVLLKCLMCLGYDAY
jgi:hypothetical protein